jgi:SAM-dependent methyltransferase
LADVLARYAHPGSALLDVGCGEKPFFKIYSELGYEGIGVDVPFSPHKKTSVDVFASAQFLPFKDCSFDVILCSEVLEHLPEPADFLAEARRVLRENGVLILTTPFLVAEHEIPYDFYRYTRYGLQSMLEKQLFDIHRIEPFGEMFGVLLSILVQVQVKFWGMMSKVFRVPLYSLFNPFVFLLIFVPQWLYLKLVATFCKFRFGVGIVEKLNYSTKGFGVVACRK